MSRGTSFHVNELELADLTVETATPILKAYAPSWDISKIQMKQFSDGHINKMVAFYVGTLGPDAIVVRLNGPGFGVFDRSREMTYQQLLRDHNIADYLLGVFKNGIVMRFIPGTALVHAGNLTPEISEKIAKKFANLHQKVPVDEKLMIGGTEKEHAMSNYNKTICSMIKDDPEFNKKLEDLGCHGVGHFVSIILANSEKFDKMVKMQKSPIVTAHCDAHLSNFMYCKDSGKLSMIDFELMRPFPAAFDLAFHLAHYASVLMTEVEEIPSRDVQSVWLKHYFDEMGNPEKDEESLINDYLDGIEIMIPIVIMHMFLATIFIGQIGTAGNHDGFDYVGISVKKYALMKKLMKSLGEKYPEIAISFEK